MKWKVIVQLSNLYNELLQLDPYLAKKYIRYEDTNEKNQ